MDPSADDRRAINRHPLGWTLAAIIGLALLAVVVWVCIAVLPSRLYPSLNSRDLVGLTPGERAERIEGQRRLQNDARTSALQGLAALLVLLGAGIGATVTWRQVRISRDQLAVTRRQMQAAAQQARDQLEIAQQRQITERYTRAIDQLGSDQFDVRIGGIYALERIARDSPSDRLTIGEVLTAFIRGHAPWPPRLPGQNDAGAPIEGVPLLKRRAPDVQASLTVVGRGGFAPPQALDDRLDLTQVDLRRAHLHDLHLAMAWLDAAHLEGADLTGAHLEQADLPRAHLEGADLTGAILRDAHLEGADLTEANLEGADLAGAHLQAAKLPRAHLRRAIFWAAHLEGADLTEAHLCQAVLIRANLDRANLTGAHLEMAGLLEAHLVDADLTAAYLEGVDLREARLDGANLSDARLERAVLIAAHFEGANLAGAQMEEADLTDARLEPAFADQRTRWPVGFDWRVAGVTVAGDDSPASPP